MTQTSIPYEFSSNYRGPEQNKKKQSDSLYLNKNVNGWDVTVSINPEGKVSLIAHKPLGSIAKAATAGDNESHISIDIESTEKRVPEFKQIEGKSRYTPEFIEVNDMEDKITEGFKKELVFYKKEYHASSILTTDEFLISIIPAFEVLLQDTRVQGIVGKISNEVSRVQPPWNKNYKQER